MDNTSQILSTMYWEFLGIIICAFFFITNTLNYGYHIFFFCILQRGNLRGGLSNFHIFALHFHFCFFHSALHSFIVIIVVVVVTIVALCHPFPFIVWSV